jgi:hypothetical protein
VPQLPRPSVGAGGACLPAGGHTDNPASRSDAPHTSHAHHVAAGNWLRIDRGVFRLAEWVPELHDDLIRWTLWSKGRGVISPETALLFSGHGVRSW